MNFELSFGSSSRNPTGCFGRVGQTLFAVIFFLVGVGFTAVVIWEAVAELKTRTWRSTPCTIVSSHVDESKPGEPFALAVTYRYDFPAKPGGPVQSWTSDAVGRNRKVLKEEDYRKVRLLADRYAPGARATCYVDPADPRKAILEKGSLLILAFVPLPLLFVVVGAVLLIASWRGTQPGAVTSKSDSSSAVSPAKWVPAIVCAVFLVAGIGFSFLFYFPARQMIAARNWTPTPATVVWSAVKSHSGEHGDTYSVEVFYEYVVDDQKHRSNRYEFMSGSSSGYDSKRSVVSRMPAGSRINCYVNPADPTDAVIDRSASWVMFFALLPLIFILIGAGGLAGIVYRRRKLRRDAAEDALEAFTARGRRLKVPAKTGRPTGS